MTPEGERIENICRAQLLEFSGEDWDDLDAFEQMLSMTFQWLQERSELPEPLPGSRHLLSYPSEAQMRECAFITMGDVWPTEGRA